MGKQHIQKWHEVVKSGDPKGLSDLIADDAVFLSPVIYKPQEGKALVYMYLHAAFHVLANDSFQYVNEFFSDTGAVLEFTTVIDGIEINGVDIITFNDAGLIQEFKVMLRPAKAVTLVQSKMFDMLQKIAG